MELDCGFIDVWNLGKNIGYTCYRNRTHLKQTWTVSEQNIEENTLQDVTLFMLKLVKKYLFIRKKLSVTVFKMSHAS